jgi:hypothetical protein
MATVYLAEDLKRQRKVAVKVLHWCTGSPPSVSDDNRPLACKQTTTASDIWLSSGFDADGR